MVYRTVNINWMPKTEAQWHIYNEARKEAARLWNDLVKRHFRVRRRNLKWPSKGRLEQWAKGRYRNLHSQTVQQIIGEFLEAVNSTRQLRKKGVDHSLAKYPWRFFHYRDVVYTNQGARIRDGYLYLPNGVAGTLRIRIPDGLPIPGRLVEVRLGLFNIILVCECPDEIQPVPSGKEIGVDLGVNTVVAATDGEKAVVISGREIKSEIRNRNKTLAKLSAKQTGKQKGSRRSKRIQKRKKKFLAKSKRRVRDILHKTTRKVANEFPGALAYVGKPFNDAAQKMGRKQAQQVSWHALRR